MSTPETLYEFVDRLRERLGLAEAVKDPHRLHNVKDLMSDCAVPERWYWDAFDELDAQGHLDDGSVKANGYNAHARLSADGRLYLHTLDEVT